MMEPSPAWQMSCALSSASAEHRQDLDLDAEWLGAQTGASVGCTHRIVRHLASGGMGHVFVAEHVYLGANAAVKVPRYADASGRRCIEAEAQLLAKLDHPNIVKALDVGQLADGRAYLLMEYVSGIELDGLLDARGSISLERCLGVLKQVASAVDYLHRRGIVHGDIKPANILIDISANDFIKLVDFGIASANTRDERRGVLGTPAYMAPEQARGEAWGALSDVYAVAALALELLTGHPPYDRHTAQDVLTAILTEPAPLPSTRGLIVPGLDAVFERGLHADPSQRYPRAGAFVQALAEVLNTAKLADNDDQTERESGEPLRPVSLQLLAAGADLAAMRPEHMAGIRGLFSLLLRILPLWRSRPMLRLAAGLVAALCVFSCYG